MTAASGAGAAVVDESRKAMADALARAREDGVGRDGEAVASRPRHIGDGGSCASYVSVLYGSNPRAR
jgi:hypothetical protein